MSFFVVSDVDGRVWQGRSSFRDPFDDKYLGGYCPFFRFTAQIPC